MRATRFASRRKPARTCRKCWRRSCIACRRRRATGRLRLNDASFTYEMETSAALGFGFRCGFLGLLHLEIIQERLQREFNLNLIATAPSVIYRITLRNGSEIQIHNPVDMTDVMQI